MAESTWTQTDLAEAPAKKGVPEGLWMKCPACEHEFKNPVAQAGGRAGGAAKVAKGFAVAGQPSAARPIGVLCRS